MPIDPALRAALDPELLQIVDDRLDLRLRDPERSGNAMLEGDASIVRRISGFRFDDTEHFSAQAYDQLWMFGIESGPGIADTEVRAVAEFMAAGRGVFATGDHDPGPVLDMALGGAVVAQKWDCLMQAG